MTSQRNWKWCGSAHHFVGSRNCRFGITTHVGDYIVSTVGEYYPARTDPQGDPEPLGFGPESVYETMVFHAGEPMDCGVAAIGGGAALEVDSERCGTPKEANAMHLRMCEKYQRSDT